MEAAAETPKGYSHVCYHQIDSENIDRQFSIRPITRSSYLPNYSYLNDLMRSLRYAMSNSPNLTSTYHTKSINVTSPQLFTILHFIPLTNLPTSTNHIRGSPPTPPNGRLININIHIPKYTPTSKTFLLPRLQSLYLN
ncbi:uncharacterized protein EAE97_004624 [Botrytis byssoidea]|uniref:Uncharacterized protein n=1 Tax=Botrytis byssoidea TaxID=139641 RepID=A0A9P5M6Q6_9HELO|nr:uncharacterized protein EAE97_004624 [Botrytis byssoidea]KAF7947375.1 hypothetical protein EAE97_004624 [Botrytis byssoidea]